VLQYLRIAVTAFSLTACVLLIALWVRSYSRMDWLAYRSSNIFVRLACTGGSGRFYWTRTDPMSLQALPRPELGWIIKSYPAPVGQRKNGAWPFQWIWQRNAVTISLPMWLVTVLFAICATVPWLRYFKRRFGLRTLLIATTLVAVALGIVVMSS
jgi:hypothetical protein